jgi:hypothetical protein
LFLAAFILLATVTHNLFSFRFYESEYCIRKITQILEIDNSRNEEKSQSCHATYYPVIEKFLSWRPGHSPHNKRLQILAFLGRITIII